MENSFDVVIAGAGPAGSATAILLAQAGWRAALVEKQPFPRRKVCGECVAASNLPLLQTLGIGAAFDALAGPELRQVAFVRASGSVVGKLPPADGTFRWGRALGRETLDGLLLQQARACGVRVMQPWALQGFDGTPGAWRAEVRAVATKSVLTLRAPIAIDAHGSWETLPSDRMRQPCKPNDLLAFKANYAGASLLAGLLPLLSFEGGYGGMVVAGQGMLTLACCVRRDRLAVLRRASPGLPAGEVVEAMLKRECAGVQDALIGASRTGPWLASGPLAPGTRVRAEDQVFRVGNAAAEAHPIIGEGISMALQSAWLLSNRLTSTRERLALADTGWQRAVGQGYCRDWHRHFARRLRLASAFAHLAMRPAFASPLMAMVRVWPGLLPWGAEWGGKTRFIHPTGHTP